MTLAVGHPKPYNRVSDGDNMTRSRRASGKPTVKQMQEQVNTIEKEFHGFGNAVAGELMKHNRLLYGLLADLGKLENIICENCKEEVSRPILKDIENTDECPSCNRNLFEKKQISLDDMHQALQSEEE